MGSNSKKYTYEEVYEIFKSRGYELLDKEYVNNRTKMSYEDGSGYRYETTLPDVNKNKSMATKSNKWSIFNIKRYIWLNGDTDILKSTDFVNQNSPLDWVCKNGHEFHTNWNNYYTKGFRCKECSKIAKMYTFEQCKELVLKRNGYKLLKMERRKNCNNLQVIYYYIEHECGHRYWTDKQSFEGGRSCKPCMIIENGIKRRDNEDQIRNRVEAETKHKYIYITSKFVITNKNNKKRKIKVKHVECGHEYWVDYAAWNRGARCRECCPLERYAIPISEWKYRVEKTNPYNLSLLNVYYKTRKDNGRNEAWLKIKCNNCGEVIDRVGGGWKNGCANCLTSKGEEMVRLTLNKLFVSFDTQKEYDNLIGVGGRKLSYDFYIPNDNLLIEYQGEFHDGTDRIVDKSYFPTQQEHDRRKREYAEQHGISLLEIWYYDFDNIESILKESLTI